MEQLFCPWESASYYIYSSNIPTLFFYSHFPALIVALLAGFIVYYKTQKSKVGVTLLITTIMFSIWSLIDLVLWATNDPRIVMFAWSVQVLVEPLVYLFAFYLSYVFIKERDLPFKFKILLLTLYAPIIIFLTTSLNLQGVNLDDCTAIEGPLAQYYTYFVELVIILSLFIFSVLEFIKSKEIARKKEIRIFSIGMVLFLLAFSWGNLIGSFTEDWVLAQAGLIGMPIFAAFLAYMIVRFKTFNIKLLGTQALVFSLGFLVLSIAFIRNIENVRLVVAFTLTFTLFLGRALVSSVRREIEQREKLQILNEELKGLLTQRESLVHLITHKVKASFTRSKYIFAEMVGGGFGELSAELKDMSKKGLDSDNEGIKTVDLVLNAFNLEKGIVKYEMAPLDFKAMVLDSAESRRAPAEAKGLKMNLEIQDVDFTISGDAFWLKEVTNNLIENAVRYTKEGSITVGLAKNNDKLLFTVKDTGVGINDEDKKNLFTEGGRGKNSVKVNVDSTGYGLFSVKLVVEAHGGRVWAESGGEGAGSTFSVELDLTNK
ncbi:MAG: ATP-binding protein [Candidatus Paceibacterota bacterium]